MASAALEQLVRFDAPLSEALRRLDREADDCPDAAFVVGALEWIAAQPRRSVVEKIDAMIRITSLKGEVFIPSLAEFLGWATQARKSPIEQFIDEIIESKTIAAAVDSGEIKITQPDLVGLFSLLRCIDRGDAGAEMRDQVNAIVIQKNDMRKKCGALLPLLRSLAVTLQ